MNVGIWGSTPLPWYVCYEFVRQVYVGFLATFGPLPPGHQSRAKFVREGIHQDFSNSEGAARKFQRLISMPGVYGAMRRKPGQARPEIVSSHPE